MAENVEFVTAQGDPGDRQHLVYSYIEEPGWTTSGKATRGWGAARSAGLEPRALSASCG